MFKKISTYIYINLLILTSLFLLFIFNKKVKSENLPFISVIVPVYNTEEYLPRCLDSLVNQTYKDIEIICVNDGSKDNSIKVLNEYAKKDKRIRVIDKENGGVSSARNVGIDNAKGEYISFIDSDDYIDLNTYEVCTSKVGEYDILGFGYKFEPGRVVSNEIDNEYNPLDYLDTKEPLVGTVWNCLFKKSLINENNIKFCTDVSYREDWVFSKMCLLKAKNLKIISDVLYHYIQRSTSIEHTRTSKLTSISAINAFKNLLKYISSNKLKNGYTWIFRYINNGLSSFIDYDEKKLNTEIANIVFEIINNNSEMKEFINNAPKDIADKISELKSLAL